MATVKELYYELASLMKKYPEVADIEVAACGVAGRLNVFRQDPDGLVTGISLEDASYMEASIEHANELVEEAGVTLSDAQMEYLIQMCFEEVSDVELKAFILEYAKQPIKMTKREEPDMHKDNAHEKKEGMELREFLSFFDFDYGILPCADAAEQRLRRDLIAEGKLAPEDMNKSLIYLIDLQGAYFGDINTERYPITSASVEKIISRMDAYINEFKKEFEAALKNRGIDPEQLSFQEQYQACKELNVDESEVSYAFATAYLNKEGIYIKEYHIKDRIEAIKEEYFDEDIVMSELLREHNELTIEEKRALLRWSGDDVYVEVLEDGSIKNVDLEEKKSVDRLMDEAKRVADKTKSVKERQDKDFVR